MRGSILPSLGPDALRQIREQIGAPAKPRKYRNEPTAHKSYANVSRVYDSKAEAAYAQMLDDGVRAGLVKWWLPQVAIPLPAPKGERHSYRADFLVVWADGRVEMVDVKGHDTAASLSKRKTVAALYGIEIAVAKGSMRGGVAA